MNVFGKILEKLGLRQDRASSGPAAQGKANGPSRAPQQSAPQTHAPGTQRPTPATPPPPAKPEPMSQTDVEAKLDALARENPQQLNWRTSIVDLMKLLGMESSLAERRELAEELGYAREDMDDSAKMNVWLHKQVLRRIAEDGGKVPRDLLD